MQTEETRAIEPGAVVWWWHDNNWRPTLVIRASTKGRWMVLWYDESYGVRAALKEWDMKRDPRPLWWKGKHYPTRRAVQQFRHIGKHSGGLSKRANAALKEVLRGTSKT